MIKRILSAAALALGLAGCSVTAPPRDNAQWTTEVHGVAITWRWTEPGALGGPVYDADGRYRAPSGHAHALPGGTSCVVDIDPTAVRSELARMAAHEAGHCLQARYLRVFADPRSDDAYTHQLLERWPEGYAQAYLRACGESLRALGWKDPTPSRCAAPPHPNDIPFSL
ncbi:hypothetical protein CBQ26_00515 [Deinococcus indicus]|uniref:Lipoprotein n=1 Tax=Deinococcus indicus TaxID=223556 RepID=A0A246BTH4_9DEIO|nr:hypothetical protein [Deinococcus indicus]OWL98975.1 hypothetical protein CBQ26_00515 [Deinococcus indicus]